MNKFFSLLSILFCLCINAQTDVSDVINIRKQYEVNKENDSTYFKFENKFKDLSFLNANTKEGREIIKKYQVSVFYHSRKNSKNVYRLHQWVTPIIVYIDKNISKDSRKNIKKFILHFNSIENLKISFTNNIDNANYYIKTTPDFESKDYKYYKFHNEESRNNFSFFYSDYKLITDNTKNIYGCLLLIDNNIKSDKILLEKSVKQLFYLSLGRFFVSLSGEEDNNSLISRFYTNQEKPDQLALEFLKIHYSIKYNDNVDGTDFYKLKKLSKN